MKFKVTIIYEHISGELDYVIVKMNETWWDKIKFYFSKNKNQFKFKSVSTIKYSFYNYTFYINDFNVLDTIFFEMVLKSKISFMLADNFFKKLNNEIIKFVYDNLDEDKKAELVDLFI